MVLKQLVPATVPNLRGARSRPSDVGEQHGLEHAIDLVLLPRSGEKLLDLVERVVVVADPAEVKGTR